jgi:hypothetical protein
VRDFCLVVVDIIVVIAVVIAVNESYSRDHTGRTRLWQMRSKDRVGRITLKDKFSLSAEGGKDVRGERA